MKFTKMHGLGNDYVYVNGFTQPVPDPAATAIAVSDRHFGIGGDGLILVLPPEPGVEADVRMRMFNADGSEGEMCGNGVRCVAKLAHDHGLSRANPLRVQTGRGVLTLALATDAGGRVEQVTVDMDEPILELPRVPVASEHVEAGSSPHGYRLPVPGFDLPEAVFVSMGNPHATLFVPDVAAIDLPRVGPLLETHRAFPRKANIHFAQVLGRSEVRMRTWERGSGITLACGTGACAVLVSGVLAGLLDREAIVHLPGGDLRIEWRSSDRHVYMTGPATEVFSGEWHG